MIRRASFVLFLAMALADLWFFANIRAFSYSTERAFEIAQAELPEYAISAYLGENGVPESILYNGRTFVERILDLPSVYTKGNRWYPVHEFVWQFSDEMPLVIWVGISPNGETVMEFFDKDEIFQDLVPYDDWN